VTNFNPSGSDQPPLVSRPESQTVQCRTLGGMFVAAGLLVLLTLALGVDDSFKVPVIASLAGSALATGLLFITAAARLPVWATSAGLLLAVAMVSVGVVASGEADTPFALLYIWIAVEGWYILPPQLAGGLTALTILASAAAMALVATEYDNAPTWWVMLVGTTLAVATLAAVLRLRADRLVATLADAASRDPLTGLLNRRGFQERAAIEMARARRYRVPLAVVVADLDHFKALNDTFGHHSGDEALAAFAALCRANTRTFDISARMGGEEFAVLLPNTSEEGAVVAAERIRQAMHAHLASPDGTPVTASFGVAVHPNHGTDLETLLGNADRALYVAKSRGRDRTIAFDAAFDAVR
jgi:diguanylate cyclase (GGDEF)-like protein